MSEIPEIEITPEMIEAGLRALDLYDRDDPDEWMISAVYRAMVMAAQNHKNLISLPEI